MHKFIRILFLFISFCFFTRAWSQCVVNVDTANIQHIICPNGGAIGSAQIIQASYINYSWHNISNGQFYNGGGGNGGTQRNDLDAGLYVILASTPYSWSCPDTIYSDTFEIIEAKPYFQFNPNQACPDTCNVEVLIDMEISIPGVNYSSSFDTYPVASLPYVIDNQCGGQHNYEIFADGISCGIDVVGISQFAQLNLSTSSLPATCSQGGIATVNITGLGASGLNTYCNSGPQYSQYSSIDHVYLIGDNSIINNNTASICNIYSDFTAFSADVSIDSTYNLMLDLGTCHAGGFALIDQAKIYIDWNIDGDFLDTFELVAIVHPTQSPSTNTLTFSVPSIAIPGQSRMRVVMQNNQYQPANTSESCDYNISYFGETEDYTIQINGSLATPISYLWSDGQTTSTATNLSPGTYIVSITDANTCTATDTVIVTGGGLFTTSITPTLQTVCLNEPADTLIVTSLGGGSGVTQYEWWGYNTGTQAFQAVIIQNQTDSFFIPPTDSVGISYYYCVVSRGLGCVDTSAIVAVETITSPSIIYQSQDSSVCVGANLTINIQDTFFINIGANTITPIYQWYENSVCDINGAVPSTGPGNNTAIYTPQTTTTGTTYYYCIIFIPQITGCNSDTSNCIEIIVNNTPTSILNAVPNPACLGNDIILTANTSIPVSRFRFQYNDGNGWINLTNPSWGINNPVTYNNITQSTDFRVKVKEANGCPVSSWSPQITVPIINFNSFSIWHN